MQITRGSKGVEKRKPSCTIGGNVNWCNHYRKNSMEIPQKTQNRTTISSSNSTSYSIYQKKTKTLIRKGIWTLMFIAVLFSIAKIWNQPKGPLRDGWIKKWYI